MISMFCFLEAQPACGPLSSLAAPLPGSSAKSDVERMNSFSLHCQWRCRHSADGVVGDPNCALWAV